MGIRVQKAFISTIQYNSIVFSLRLFIIAAVRTSSVEGCESKTIIVFLTMGVL